MKGAPSSAATARPPLGAGWTGLAIAVAAALMASNMVVARAAAGHVPPFGMAFWRWAVTAGVLLPLSWRELRAHRPAVLAGWRGVALCGLLGMGLCGAPIYIGARTTQATNIGLIMAASPILVAAWQARFAGERVTMRRAAGLLLGLGGVAAILTRGTPLALLHLRFSAGDLIVLGSMLAWAGYTVAQAQVLRGLSSSLRIGLFALVGALLNLPFAAAELAAGRMAADGATLAALAFVGLFPGALAYWLYGVLVGRAGPSHTSLMMYVVPVAAASLAVLFLGERLQGFHLAGAALVAGGLVLATGAARSPARDGASRQADARAGGPGAAAWPSRMG